MTKITAPAGSVVQTSAGHAQITFAAVVPASMSPTTTNLAADVDLSDGLAHDGPSKSCVAGTWELDGCLQIQDGGGSTYTAKLWDGTTVARSAKVLFASASGGPLQILLHAFVSPGSTTTYKLTVTSDHASGGTDTLKKDVGLGNNATYLMAKKIG